MDANLNRAREGLRVLEDTARFVWRAPAWSRSFKGMRHALDQETRRNYEKLCLARDAQDDLGRQEREPSRRNFRGLVAANFRRAEEALRVLEEYAKVLVPTRPSHLKVLRYQLYDLEKRVWKRLKDC